MMTFKFSFTQPVSGETEHYFPCLGQTGWNYTLDKLLEGHRIPLVRSYNPQGYDGLIMQYMMESDFEEDLDPKFCLPRISTPGWFYPEQGSRTFTVIRDALAAGKFGNQPQLEVIAENLVDECNQVIALLEEAAASDIQFMLAPEEAAEYPAILDQYVAEDNMALFGCADPLADEQDPASSSIEPKGKS